MAYIWRIITKWTCLHNQHPEGLECFQPPEPPLCAPLSTAHSSSCRGPHPDFWPHQLVLYVCISYRRDLQDALCWGCSVTPQYASGPHPCWTIRRSSWLLSCPPSLLWRALWVCTAICVCPVDGHVDGPSWLLLNYDMSVLCLGLPVCTSFW